MRQNNRVVGTNYEKIAGEYLVKNGYEIVMYNFRCRVGEIDIIAREKEYLVFCEVKYRKTECSGHPYEAISLAKQRTISRCAAVYLQQNRLQEMPCRFDVVGILGEQIELIKNAFDFME